MKKEMNVINKLFDNILKLKIRSKLEVIVKK